MRNTLPGRIIYWGTLLAFASVLTYPILRYGLDSISEVLACG